MHSVFFLKPGVTCTVSFVHNTVVRTAQQNFNRNVLQRRKLHDHLHFHQLSTITGYRLPGDQNVTQLDTSQDESKHPYTSTTLMSINVHKCQLLQFQHFTRKAKTSYKKSADDTV